MAFEKVEYGTESVLIDIGGKTRNAATFKAGTYVKGQLLGRIDATGLYAPYAAAGDDGTQIVRKVCVKDSAIANDGDRAPVAHGEFSLAGVKAVMAALAEPVALDDVLIGQCDDAGIVLN
jgi:hypothetical protein